MAEQTDRRDKIVVKTDTYNRPALLRWLEKNTDAYWFSGGRGDKKPTLYTVRADGAFIYLAYWFKYEQWLLTWSPLGARHDGPELTLEEFKARAIELCGAGRK